MNTRKTVTINDFLTLEEICQARCFVSAKEICRLIIEPNIGRINQSLGQENDPMFLAYAVEYAITQVVNDGRKNHRASDTHIRARAREDGDGQTDTDHEEETQ